MFCNEEEWHYHRIAFSDFLNFVKIIILLNLRLKVVLILILTNTADPDEMQHYATFHLGIHCLPKCAFRGIQEK